MIVCQLMTSRAFMQSDQARNRREQANRVRKESSKEDADP
jgi:hypothetical protein